MKRPHIRVETLLSLPSSEICGGNGFRPMQMCGGRVAACYLFVEYCTLKSFYCDWFGKLYLEIRNRINLYVSFSLKSLVLRKLMNKCNYGHVLSYYL